MFDERKHPRDKDGKFTDGNGADRSDKLATAVRKYSDTPDKDLKSMGIEANKTSIKEQVRENLDKIRNTAVLAHISKEKVSEDFNDTVAKLKAELDKNNGFVSRKGFGEIQVSSRLFGAKKYLKTKAEIAAVSVIPAILENGIQIGEHKNHKGRDYSTVTFAGKVTIAGKEGVLAVTVMRTTGNFYKVHRVLTPSGDVFTA